MKIINRNQYNIMYGMEFINAGEIKEITKKEDIKLLLAQPNVEEFADVKDLKAIEEENKKLKEELEKSKQSKQSKQSKTKAEKEEKKEE